MGSMYGDYEKDYIYEEMISFVEKRENGISELAQIFSNVVSHFYWKSINLKTEDIRKECAEYREKYIKMKELLK